MYSCISESDASIGSGKQHLLTSFIVVRILNRSNEVLRYPAQRLQRPQIADRIRALIGGSQDRPLGPRATIEGQCGEGLDRVTEDIKSARGRHLPRHASGVVRIQYPDRRLESSMGNAGLGVQWRVIENRDPGGLAAGSSGRRHRDQWLEWPGNRTALADRSIDVFQKFRRIGGVEIRGFGRVDRRPAADRDQGVETPLDCKIGRLAKRRVGGLDSNSIKERKGDSAVLEAFDDGGHG
jgi:hypothetical protein